MSSPFPFRIGYVLDYVCHFGSLPNGGATNSFSLTLSILLSMARWLVSSFFTNAFVRDHVWYPFTARSELNDCMFLSPIAFHLASSTRGHR